MSHHNVTLAALIGSRICHDLISPIGAVSNGLELMEMSDIARGPEMSLITDSVANANARIRLFRIAFGMSSHDQRVASCEIADTLAAAYSDRVQINWTYQGTLSRQLAQALLLAILCVERAIPFGGVVTVSENSSRWTVSAESERVNLEPVLWAKLNGSSTSDQASPAEVQFLLLPELLKAMGRSCDVITEPSRVVLTI